MAEGLSCCEALLVADADERRAILSTLSRHPDRNAIDLLRWALASPHPDLAVEAALALEDIGATFDATLAAQPCGAGAGAELRGGAGGRQT